VSIGVEKPASAAPQRYSAIGGSTRFVPGESNSQVTVVNGKVQLGQRLRDLWHSRDLLGELTRTELKVKYKNSVLGYLWSMLNPALVLLIYYAVFSIIAKNGVPQFAIWLFAGLLAWNLFNGAAMGSTGVVVGKAGIVKKVAFPRELLALSVVGVAMIMFVLQLVVLVLALAVFHHSPDFSYVAVLPLALVALIVFTAAVSVFLSAVNVYLRDTQHLTEVLLMAWFWATPIVYYYGQIASRTAKPGLVWIKYLYLCNPVTPIVLTFQRAIYGRADVKSTGVGHPVLHLLPPWTPLGYAGVCGIVLAVGVVLFLLAMVVFGRLEGNFAEEL
jgi:ABC-2 type transport system permease protein